MAGQEIDPAFPNECIIPLDHGGALRCPGWPDECTYVRVTNHEGIEVGYWSIDEWREDDETGTVMGAIMGAAKEALRV